MKYFQKFSPECPFKESVDRQILTNFYVYSAYGQTRKNILYTSFFFILTLLDEQI